MRLAERVLEVLQRTGPLDDDQLATQLGVRRQSVRTVAMRLSDQGLVKRQRSAGGKLATGLLGQVIPPPPPKATKPAARKLSPDAVQTAVLALYQFTRGYPPKGRLIGLEAGVVQRDVVETKQLLADERIDDNLLTSALVIKQLAGEINVVIHAVGMLLAIPRIINEPGEEILTTSLGAGSGTKPFDLVTTKRVAEFKFQHWQGGDSVRQRELFADFVNLAESDDPRKRQLFVTCLDLPKHFLFHSERQLTSVCDRRPKVLAKIRKAHGSSYQTVSEYVNAVADRVELVDLKPLLPAYITEQIEAAEETSDELQRDELDG